MIVVAIAAFMILGNKKAVEGAGHSANLTAAPAGNDASKSAVAALPVVAATVGRQSMRQMLDVSGSLKTDDDVQIGSRLAGKVVQVTVKEGDRVTRGQVLVRLDDREPRAQLGRARGALAAARARLSLARNQGTYKDAAALSEAQRTQAALASSKGRLQQAETAYKMIDTEVRLRIDTANSGVRVATERLSIAKDLTRKQELQSQKLAVDQATALKEQARVDMENARQSFTRREALYKQDAIAKEEVDEAERRFKAMEAALRVAEGQVSVAQQRLELATEGSRPEEVRIAEGQLNAANRNLEQARSEEQRRLVAQEEVNNAKSAIQEAEAAVSSAKAGLVQSKVSLDEIANAQAAIQQAQADIQFYEAQFSDLTIRSPVDGVVSTRQVNVGEMVTASTPLMNVLATDTVYFEAQVPEMEVSLLRPGMTARVVIDSVGDRKWSGTVREVIPVADRSSRSFRVRVAVLGGGGRLAVGGFARATVDVGTRSNTVVVPKDAVKTESGDRFVWVIEKGEGDATLARRRLIRTGLIDERLAEVLDGLKEGERIIRSGSPAITDGTTVKAE